MPREYYFIFYSKYPNTLQEKGNTLIKLRGTKNIVNVFYLNKFKLLQSPNLNFTGHRKISVIDVMFATLYVLNNDIKLYSFSIKTVQILFQQST